MRHLRSWLFVPGSNSRRIERALAVSCDAVIFDLEDSCPPGEKAAGRQNVAEALSRPCRSVKYVRINGLTSDFAFADLQTVIKPGISGVMLPKSASMGDIRTLDWMIGQLEREQGMPRGDVGILPLIETAAGIENAVDIARASLRVARMAFGAGDLTLELGLRWSREEEELAPFRLRLVQASRLAGVEPPIDAVWIDIGDGEGLARSAARSRAHGYQGKMCIHPNQLSAVHAAFVPTRDEIAAAERVVSAFAAAESEGSASIQVDGRLVDYPLFEAARRTLDAAAS